MESSRLEDELISLHNAMQGSIKGILHSWDDIMFKVKAGKMGLITLTPADIETIDKALIPVRIALKAVDTSIITKSVGMDGLD